MTRMGIAALSVFLTSCAVGPNYRRPNVALPDQYRAATPNNAGPSIAETKWFNVFQDDTLQGLVNTALEKNFDLRIAAERVQQARAQLGITRAEQFPFVDGQAAYNVTRTPTTGAFAIPGAGAIIANYAQAGLALSWEIDLWGRLRRLTESARAQYLATEEGRHGVITSLIGDVTTGYFSLLEQDLELDISRKTRDIAADNLRLVTLRHDRGAATGLDVHQAEQLLYTATAQIAGVERNRGTTENALSLLLGEAPHGIPRTRKLEDMPLAPDVPAGLPSELIARRPDIRQAEQNLIAFNAQIGAARALYFPRISLTALVGSQSRVLGELLNARTRQYSVAPSALIPIFHAGQIRNTVRLTEAQQREALIAYQRSIYGALREVSDALISHTRLGEQRAQQQELVRALTDTANLSTLRYKGGLDSYLQVLDAQRNLFQGQLVLAQLQLQERLAIVQLYRALGGGWQ